MLVVVQSILVHTQQFIRLRETVPGPVVLSVDVCDADATMVQSALICGFLSVLTEGVLTHSLPIRFNSGMGVLHLHILVTHERPRCQVGPVKLRGAPEILDSLLMLSS